MKSSNQALAEFAQSGWADGAKPRPLRRPSFRLSDLWTAPLHDLPIRDEIIYQYLPLSPAMKVLEVGPGSGFTAFRLSRHVQELTLVEISFYNATRLKGALEKIPNLRFICADVAGPGLGEVIAGRFNAIYGMEMFEYVSDPGMCLKNFGTLLRPGGTLLLEFPNYPPEKSPGITCFRERKEIDRWMRAAGFQSWEVYALRLRPWARLMFDLFHERPIRFYRRWRDRGRNGKPMIYEQTWAFQNKSEGGWRKAGLHLLWSVLFAAMRLGGDCFERLPLGEDILHHDLLLVAHR
jgi:SAM-dependent methyltransferase